MASQDAKNVAKEVLDTMGKGKKVVLGEIIRRNGYSDNTADTPQLVTETQSYKGVIAPYVERLKKERDRAFEAMSTKDLDKVQYEDLVRATDSITKNIQLLTGGATERIGVTGVEISIRRNES